MRAPKARACRGLASLSHVKTAVGSFYNTFRFTEKAMTQRQKLKEKLFSPVDGSSLTVFRVGFGIIMFWDAWRYCAAGWVEQYYIQPDIYFKYFGFEWIQPWGGDGMYYHFAFMGLCALLVAIGAFYRLAIILFTLAFSYVFLLDQTRYLNHFYLVTLFSLLLCIIPAHRQFSVDAWRRPRLRSPNLPAWTLWLLRAQVEIMLIFAGIVKINSDWLQLQPLKMWLAARGDFSFGLGYLFTQDWAVAAAAYGVILLHIVGAPLLLWRRARLAVFCIYAAFHTLNHFVFNIGIFPWFTLFASLLFFEPDWPNRLWHSLKSKTPGFATTLPAGTNAAYFTNGKTPADKPPPMQQNLTMGFLVLWISVQLLLPLRHFFYPGNVSWTEEGHRFAWRMKLRDKEGWADFYVIDPNNRGNITHVDPQIILTAKQARRMAGHPDMILQFAHYLAKQWREHYGITDVEVYASAFVSLNGRKFTLLVDPQRDLAKVERGIGPADWILPLTQPLPGSSIFSKLFN